MDNPEKLATQGTTGYTRRRFCVFLRLVYPVLPVSLDCPFFTAHSVFSNVYLRISYEQPTTRSTENYWRQLWGKPFWRHVDLSATQNSSRSQMAQKRILSDAMFVDNLNRNIHNNFSVHRQTILKTLTNKVTYHILCHILFHWTNLNHSFYSISFLIIKQFDHHH
jgi:hypothetical protein